jgi:hypothetical protein
MAPIQYDGRVFRPVVNSASGQVSGETEFRYSHRGDRLTATYSGGEIRAGQILGLVAVDGSLELLYHHLTNGGELRSGHCRSRPEQLPDGRLRLHEKWEWTWGDRSNGESVVEEVLIR